MNIILYIGKQILQPISYNIQRVNSPVREHFSINAFRKLIRERLGLVGGGVIVTTNQLRTQHNAFRRNLLEKLFIITIMDLLETEPLILIVVLSGKVSYLFYCYIIGTSTMLVHINKFNLGRKVQSILHLLLLCPMRNVCPWPFSQYYSLKCYASTNSECTANK